MTTMDILRRTKAAWPSICNASAEDKNRILSAMADSLQAECDAILRCNAEDMDAARGHISDVMLDRLYLDKDRIDAMADGIRATVALPDHTGRILAQIDHPNGMKIYKKQVPLGLVAIIYESRPNVTSDAAALTIKSGNVCMLRSGKEAFRTAKAIVAALKQGIASAGGDPDIVNIVEDTSHQSATEIMQAKGLVDLLIPRGGAGLIRSCVQNATVPCIETGTGICHVYVDEYADLDKAVRIIENAKTSRPSVCNAEEVCLVHRAVAARFLPMLKRRWSMTARRRASHRSSCGWMRQRRRSSTARALPTRTLTRSIWTISSPLAWSTVWTPPSRTCSRTRRTTATPSSPRTPRAPSASSTVRTARQRTSTSPPALPTGVSSASAARWASPRRSSTPAAPWARRAEHL